MIYTLTLNPAIDRELTITEVQFDSVLPAVHSRVDVGGKGFNVSRLLWSMGTPSIALGFVGGNAGDQLSAGLQALGVATDFVAISGETRTNVSIVTERHDHYLKVNEKGPLVSEASQQVLLDKIAALAQAGDWWVLAGSVPPGVSASYYARIIKILNHRGAVCILDTTGESLRQGCEARPFLVKPNAQEVHWLTGLPVDTLDQLTVAAAVLRDLGAQNVVVSLGKEGALLHTADGTWQAQSPRIQEKNPIGAGDSMVGGMVWSLSQGHALKDALGWGIASGAATAALSGTAVGTRESIEALHQRVELKPL
ncbi:MAG TPA: 1-phosphofructokinase [Anaerolineales bacterium]|nr:1-phosphofructokinase [Anaerolineales bacterium]